MKKNPDAEYESSNKRKFSFRMSTAKNCLKYPGCIWTMNCVCSNCLKFETNIKKYNNDSKL